MKKLILLCIFAVLFSCNHGPIGNNYVDGPTRFVVTDIITDASLINMNIYYIEVIDLNGFSTDNNGRNDVIKCTDIKGKFYLGQVINFGDLK